VKKDRYSRFCRINATDPLEYDSVRLLCGQMLASGVMHSYAALHVRTAKKLFKRHSRVADAYRLESLASRVELRGAGDAHPDVPALSEADVKKLIRHSDPQVAITTELLVRGALRVSDVRRVQAVHVCENEHGFLITLMGGKNHRKTNRAGKLELQKGSTPARLATYLRRVARGDKTLTPLSTADYNDRVSAILGHRVTSRCVRQVGLDAALADATDARTGVTDYHAAAGRTHHWSSNTLKAFYHKHALKRR
jgi:hypothetical protein